MEWTNHVNIPPSLAHWTHGPVSSYSILYSYFIQGIKLFGVLTFASLDNSVNIVKKKKKKGKLVAVIHSFFFFFYCFDYRDSLISLNLFWFLKISSLHETCPEVNADINIVILTLILHYFIYIVYPTE